MSKVLGYQGVAQVLAVNREESDHADRLAVHRDGVLNQPVETHFCLTQVTRWGLPVRNRVSLHKTLFDEGAQAR
jgi:hypothetical protein